MKRARGSAAVGGGRIAYRAAPVLMAMAVAATAVGQDGGSVPDTVVRTTGDAGPGSLRFAVAAAAGAAAATFATTVQPVTFDPSLDGVTITLAGAPIVIAGSVTIDASELPSGVTVDAAGLSRVFKVGFGNNVRVVNVAITGGRTFYRPGETHHGAGVYNEGNLSLEDCTVTGNATAASGPGGYNAPSGGHGGGIYNLGSLRLSACRVTANTTAPGGFGIHYASGQSGDGGGVYNIGTLTVSHSVFSMNSTGHGSGSQPGGGGGAIYNAGSMELAWSSIEGNRTGEGGSIWGGLPGGEGGGLANAGVAVVVGSAIVGNSTGDGAGGYVGAPGGAGGGVANRGDLVVVSSTMAENTTGAGGSGTQGAAGDGGPGGGVFNNGTLFLINATVAENRTGPGGVGTAPGPGGSTVEAWGGAGSGAGVYNGERQVGEVTMHGVLGLENSVVASNRGDGGIVSDVAGVGTVLQTGNNLIGGDPGLAPLGDHGGPTPTMPPGPGSPAIDAAGEPDGGMPLSGRFDQRGWDRVAGAAPDLGAYESGHPAGFRSWAAESLPRGSDVSFGADGDGDGVSNGATYAGFPLFTGAPPSAGGKPQFTLTFRRPIPDDVTWKLTHSVDLVEFVRVAEFAAGDVAASPGEAVTGELSELIGVAVDGRGSGFFRLEAALGEAGGPPGD